MDHCVSWVIVEYGVKVTSLGSVTAMTRDVSRVTHDGCRIGDNRGEHATCGRVSAFIAVPVVHTVVRKDALGRDVEITTIILHLPLDPHLLLILQYLQHQFIFLQHLPDSPLLGDHFFSFYQLDNRPRAARILHHNTQDIPNRLRACNNAASRIIIIRIIDYPDMASIRIIDIGRRANVDANSRLIKGVHFRNQKE